jgi:transcriptional regulator with XRE-family HTH domain
MTTLSKSFGATVRQHRINLGLSQEKFAEKAGVSRNFQGSVERGESSLSLDVAGRFALTLGMKLSELLVKVEQGISPASTGRKRVRATAVSDQ